MPAQPPEREPEEEMEADGESQLPETNGEVEEPKRGGGGEETMEESTEERESDMEESEEEEEEEESSEMDDEDCERRRGECLDEMMDLEKQFQELKENRRTERRCDCRLFRERLNQAKVKLDEVLIGRAGEYREPLAALQTSMQIQTRVAGVYRELCLQVIKHKHECEVQGARQHLESERSLLFDAMKAELLEKIRRLEEDRQNIDLSSEWSDEMRGKKCNKRRNLLGRSDRKKKVALVSGPFIVYMLRDMDILEDWTTIKKAKAAPSPLKRKVEKQ
ncbi:breast cancer metastasis-suppressor 1 isoform X1 [Nothobranchius furzeri]|uniref:breast cancer metastasis-suppressor 1 isoform X1 n=1 Tax=Nothobranchius furzeri TaxID=105023 RepID=UPI00077D14DF